MTAESRTGRRGEQKRRWDLANAAQCACGRSMSRGSRVCALCRRKAQHAKRTARRNRIATLWREGLSTKRIAEAIGSTEAAVDNEISFMRAAGWDVPRRRGGRAA